MKKCHHCPYSVGWVDHLHFASPPRTSHQSLSISFSFSLVLSPSYMSLLTPLLFSFLPGQITHLLVPRISSALPQLLPPAPKGTPAYARNYRLVFTLVILLYVAYTFRAEDSGSEEEWYSLLGLRRDADDDAIRRAFRSL